MHGQQNTHTKEKVDGVQEKQGEAKMHMYTEKSAVTLKVYVCVGKRQRLIGGRVDNLHNLRLERSNNCQ